MKPNCLPHVTPLLSSLASEQQLLSRPGPVRPSPDTAHTHSLHKIKFSISEKTRSAFGIEPQLIDEATAPDPTGSPSNHPQ